LTEVVKSCGVGAEALIEQYFSRSIREPHIIRENESNGAPASVPLPTFAEFLTHSL
jgi:hypothetical protein